MDPHDKFELDLKSLIESKLQEGHKIILMGDFNVPVNRENRFTVVLTNLGLTETLTKKYQAKPNQLTYKYGSTTKFVL